MESDGDCSRFLFLRTYIFVRLLTEPAVLFPRPHCLHVTFLILPNPYTTSIINLFSIFISIDLSFYLNTVNGKVISFTKKIV